MGKAHIPSISAEKIAQRKPGIFTLIDIRKRPAAEASGLMLRGAIYVEPMKLSFAHPVLQLSGFLVFYCVHGHEVSQFGCALARVAGRDAAYVVGGFAALRAAGADTMAFGEQADG